VLSLKHDLYGQKQAGKVWNEYLHEGLIAIGFIQSNYDECVYYRNGTVFLVHVENGILAGPSVDHIDSIIAELQESYNMTDEGDITDYLGVNVTILDDGRIKLSQPHLIAQINKDVHFQSNTKP
jgi:hypothetical protein